MFNAGLQKKKVKTWKIRVSPLRHHLNLERALAQMTNGTH